MHQEAQGTMGYFLFRGGGIVLQTLVIGEVQPGYGAKQDDSESLFYNFPG